MANKTLTNVFSDIADAIRAKGATEQMTPVEMADTLNTTPGIADLFIKHSSPITIIFKGVTNLPTPPMYNNNRIASPFIAKNYLNISRVEFPDLSSIESSGGNLFCYGLTTLTAVSVLPPKTLANSCYNSMFEGCTSLKTAPSLPATTLAQGCYSRMFYGCTSLSAAPELPVMTLVNNCYNGMFQGCTSLATAPELPATTLKSGCYNTMFYNCTSLSAVPELPAATLAENCYRSMFYGCRSLTGTITIPVLNTNTSIPSSAFQIMFQNCSNLTKVILDFSTFSAIPTLDSTNNINVFNSTTDTRFEIHVPVALEETWKTATNWSTYAARIVGV